MAVSLRMLHLCFAGDTYVQPRYGCPRDMTRHFSGYITYQSFSLSSKSKENPQEQRDFFLSNFTWMKGCFYTAWCGVLNSLLAKVFFQSALLMPFLLYLSGEQLAGSRIRGLSTLKVHHLLFFELLKNSNVPPFLFSPHEVQLPFLIWPRDYCDLSLSL